jgi:hypothetical protein
MGIKLIRWFANPSAEHPDSQEAILEAAGRWSKITALVRSSNSTVQHGGLLLCGALVVNGMRSWFHCNSLESALLRVFASL